jgi:hypothetical protein
LLKRGNALIKGRCIISVPLSQEIVENSQKAIEIKNTMIKTWKLENFSHSLHANPLARSPGQVNLDPDK